MNVREKRRAGYYLGGVGAGSLIGAVGAAFGGSALVLGGFGVAMFVVASAILYRLGRGDDA